MRLSKVFKNVVSIILVIILLPIFLIFAVILVDSWIHPDQIPSFFGWKPFIVLSGSMETEIYAGDVAVVKTVDPSTLKVGDVIAFKDKEIVITHRIIDIEEEDGETHYYTKGDNNNVEDKGFVRPDEIEGIYMFKLSCIGNFAMYLQTPLGLLVCLAIPVILFVLLQMIDNRNNRKMIKSSSEKEKELKEEIARLKSQNKEDKEDKGDKH